MSETAERICAKFMRKTCLVGRSDEFEGQGQRSRSPGTKTAFSAISAACMRFMFGKTSLLIYAFNFRTYKQNLPHRNVFTSYICSAPFYVAYIGYRVQISEVIFSCDISTPVGFSHDVGQALRNVCYCDLRHHFLS